MGTYVYTLRKKPLVTECGKKIGRYQYAYKPYNGIDWGDGTYNRIRRNEAKLEAAGGRASEALGENVDGYVMCDLDDLEEYPVPVYRVKRTPLASARFDDAGGEVIGYLRRVKMGRKKVLTLTSNPV